MLVVSNTSPLWNLASIQRLDLLHDQFPDIRIPHEVWQELQVGQDYPEAARLQQAVEKQWITDEALKTPYIQQSLMLEIDRGEAAAITLALELGVSQVLIDETDGRIAAKAMGLRPIGILGVLLRAKHAGKILSLSHEMLRLKHEAGFFIAEALFQQLQHEAGEGT